jgi:hypothetical protein
MDEYIGDREEGFLFETENGKMLSPETLFRDGFKTIFKKMGRAGVRFHAFPSQARGLGGASRNDLRAFPDPVQDHMGYAIYVAL